MTADSSATTRRQRPDARLPVRAGVILRVRAVWMIPLIAGSVVHFGEAIQRPGADGEKTPQNRLMDTPIEELDLSVRAFNCLKANEIQTVGQLLQKKEEELLALRNFGRKSLDEIKEKLVEKSYIKPEELDTVFH